MFQSAPVFSVPSTDLVSVEYPSFLGDADVPRALESVGGLGAFSRALDLPADGSEPAAIELRLTPEDPYEHPVEGGSVSSANLVLKVTRRRRRKGKGRQAEAGQDSEGVFTVEPVGLVRRAVRFRGSRASLLSVQLCLISLSSDCRLPSETGQIRPSRSSRRCLA
jgi:general transcription factor 3C polypeptide 5 (transcription factor C subunit 1)